MWIIFLKGLCVLVRVEIVHKSKCHKIIMIYPQPVRRNYHPKYTLITLAPVSYLRSLVVRAVHRHRTGIGSIPAGGLIVDEFFSTVPGRISTCVQFPLVLRHINPLEKLSTSSEVPQNHSDLIVYRYSLYTGDTTHNTLTLRVKRPGFSLLAFSAR